MNANEHDQLPRYEIVLRGRLGRALTVWFAGMDVRSSGPDETVVISSFQDQAALHGFLVEIGDLGLELSSVRLLGADE